MWKVVLLEQAEEKPEACVLGVFVLPFQAGSLEERRHRKHQDDVTLGGFFFLQLHQTIADTLRNNVQEGRHIEFVLFEACCCRVASPGSP